MIEVTLTWHEMALAANVGVRRQLERFRAEEHGGQWRDYAGGTSTAEGGRGRGWHLHIEGACGEMALAKALGRYWNGSVNTFGSGGDVGAVQVRTRSRHDFDLFVRPERDSDDDYFVLVTGVAPTFRVHGWMRGAEAKSRSDWLQDHGGHGPAYFVPKAELHRFAVLEQMRGTAPTTSDAPAVAEAR